MLQVHNGSAVGCLMLLPGSADVIHEPIAAACVAAGAAAMWPGARFWRKNYT
jgi:hypothetical protein